MFHHRLICLLALPLVASGCFDTAPGGSDADTDTCGRQTLAIGTVQGRTPISPHNGQQVAVAGVVTAVFQEPGSLEGFFLQDPRGDGDTGSSDGLFVHAPQAAVEPGSVVRVAGTVAEQEGMTVLDAVSGLERCAAGVAEPVQISLDGRQDLEMFEGMLVRLDQPLTFTDLYDLGRRGRWRASAGPRLVAPTNATAPTGTQRPPTLVIDDGSRLEPAPALLLGESGLPPRVGDQVAGLLGVMVQDHDGYALDTLRPVHPTANNPRPAAPPRVGGALRVASFNVLNFFTTLNSRGAQSQAELARQQAKLVAAITALDADILALIEIENGGPALERLARALSTGRGDHGYRVVGRPASRVGDDAIRVALLFRPQRLETVGPMRVLADPVYRGRPPIAQTFRRGSWLLTVVATHWKSKGGCDRATGPDRDQRDGQGCWNDLRVRQARRMLDLIRQLQDASHDPDVLLVGDFNAYGAEDPVTALSASLRDLTARFVAPRERYSFVYRGQAGSLDYAFATPSLATQVTGAGYWHSNADETRALDYRSDNPPGWYRPDAFRASDHDPVLVGLEAPQSAAPGP